MVSKTLLALSAAALGAGFYGARQDPSFEFPVGLPIVANETLQQQKSVSVSFKNATVHEVIDWLTNQGVSFVTAELPMDRRINLNMTNQPIEQVVEAIASALGGRWEMQGNIHVFKPNNYYVATFGEGGKAEAKVFNTQGKALDEKTLKELREKSVVEAKRWEELTGKLMKEFGPGSKFHVEIEQQMQADAKKWEEIAKKMNKDAKTFEFNGQFGPSKEELEKMHKEIQGQIRVWAPNSKEHQELMKRFGQMPRTMLKEHDFYRLDLKGIEGLQKELGQMHRLDAKEMEKLHKELGQNHRLDAKEMEKLHKELGKVHQMDAKEMEKLRKELSQIQGMDPKEMAKLQKELGQVYRMDPTEMEKLRKELGEIQRIDPKMMQKIELEVAEAMKGLQGTQVPMPPTAMFRNIGEGQDLPGLARSLSKEQREKHRRQGYLNLSDLTPNQKKMLGSLANMTGKWNITYERDGEKFTVRNEKK